MTDEEKMTPQAADEELAKLDGWERDGDAIEKTYELDSFPAAVAFTTRLSFLAEAADHHPDIDIRYRRVKLVLSTHSAGGLTHKDFSLAADIDRLAG